MILLANQSWQDRMQEKFSILSEIPVFERLRKLSMKTSYWFVALNPFVSAGVAFATAAAMIRRSRINSSNRP
jgi:hypothetical protein